MALLIVRGVLLLAVAGALLAHAFALPHLRMSARLREIDTYGFKAADGEAAGLVVARPPFGSRLNAFAERVGRRAAGTGWRAPVEGRSLRAAGLYSITPEAFPGYRVILSVFLPGVPFLLALSGPVGAA